MARARSHYLIALRALAFAAAASLLPGLGCKDAAVERPAQAAPPAKTRTANAPTPKQAKGLLVDTTALAPVTIERFYHASGTLRALREAEVHSLSVGLILRVNVEEGDHVRAGQALVQLDGRERALQSQMAQVQLQNLQRELSRLQSIQADAIPEEEIELKRDQVEEARASAAVTSFQAKQMWIRAPFTGTVVERLVDEGNLATPDTTLVRLADMSALELELFVPEQDAAKVAAEARVEVELVDGSLTEARIHRRAPVVDPLTGTVKFVVRATKLPQGAKPGAFARARILVDRRVEAPSLPNTAVFPFEGAPHVYVVADGLAKRVSVDVGLKGDARVEVRAGLSKQDTIVTQGGVGITEGMPLRPANTSSRTASDTHPSGNRSSVG